MDPISGNARRAGLVILTDQQPAPHLAPLFHALRNQRVGSASFPVAMAHAGSSKSGAPVLSSAPSWALDLTADGQRPEGGCISVLVEEGPYLYPIGAKRAGWGSVISVARTAKVLLVWRAAEGVACLLGEAEVRTDRIRPRVNAFLFSRAAAVLIARGSSLHRRQPIPIDESNLRVPVVGPWAHCVQLTRRVGKAVARRVRKHQEAQWTIGIVRAKAVGVGEAFPWRAVRWIEPPDDGFIADPFLVEHNGALWLFYEHLGFAEGKGTLWVAPFDAQTPSLEGGRKVLEQPFHLSFPNVFQADGQWYMLPEQSRSGRTALYCATEFPYEWRLLRDLLPEFPGIDPVLFRHDDKWWLFVTHGTHPCNENNLHVFWADSLYGEFRPHPMNPIHTGLRGSRMAGPVRNLDGHLLRPGQDCHDGYGEGVILFEITELDICRYAEHERCIWPPSRQAPFGDAFHTYMACGDFVAVDGRREGE